MQAGANASGDDIGHFPDVAHDVGLAINQQSGGGIMEDFNGDGHLDVVTTTIDVCGRMNLFLNDGKGRFVDHTEAAGLAGQLGGLNVVHADYDSDGDVDLLVLRGGWLAADGRMRNSLLRNDGQGRFTDVTGAAGLARPAYPTEAAAWADYDSDGDLDLYIGNENQNNSANYPSQLFRNDKNKFTDVASEAGVLNYRPAKGVAWGDYDDDGEPDLYVSNIGANRLYRNNGDGTFRDVALTLNVTKPEGRSFPTWWFDYDNDGHLDLFVASYEATLNDVASGLMGRPTGRGYPKLYRNTGEEGRNRFEEVGSKLGLTDASLVMGANFGDLDNDGYLDMYLGLGEPRYDSIAPNLMYRNDAGNGFQNVSYSGGFAHLQKGHGIGFGDIDNDGDQDVFQQMGGAFPGDAYPSVLYLTRATTTAGLALTLCPSGA